MNPIKSFVESAINQVDNGNFFREPMKIFYIINGIVAFFIPILYLVAVIAEWHDLVGRHETWTMITSATALFLIFIWLFIVSYIVFIYWTNRAKHLSQNVRTGDQIVAIPVWAHYIQCNGEAGVLYFVLATLGSYCFFYVFAFLSGFSIIGADSVGEFIGCTLGGILLFAVLALLIFLICYPILLLTHIISEKLRIKAQIANDLRDVSDIHRAATMAAEV